MKTTENRSLRVQLTQEEIMERSLDLAKSSADLEKHETDKKAVMCDFNNRIAGARSSMLNLASSINNGYEHCDVECRWNYDWENGYKELARLDTMECIDKRKISDFERQEHIKFEGAAEEV